jgi:acetyl-CoA carboxylase carboxyl transferase subunit alpha
MHAYNLVDGIIDEPLGGAHRDHGYMANQLKTTILTTLAELSVMDPHERIDRRIEKFCNMGVVVE